MYENNSLNFCILLMKVWIIAFHLFYHFNKKKRQWTLTPAFGKIHLDKTFINGGTELFSIA